MKRIISLLSVLFVCVLICTGCSVKKSSQITKSDFEKTLYPKDVVGELIIENEAANKEKSAFYTNEHFISTSSEETQQFLSETYSI